MEQLTSRYARARPAIDELASPQSGYVSRSSLGFAGFSAGFFAGSAGFFAAPASGFFAGFAAGFFAGFAAGFFGSAGFAAGLVAGAAGLLEFEPGFAAGFEPGFLTSPEGAPGFAGDFDGDSRVDLALSNDRKAVGTSLLLQLEPGHFERYTLARTRLLGVFDRDADGDDELMLVDLDEGS